MRLLGRIAVLLLRGLRYGSVQALYVPPLPVIIEQLPEPLPLAAMASAGAPECLQTGTQFPDVRLSPAEERIWNELVEALSGRAWDDDRSA